MAVRHQGGLVTRYLHLSAIRVRKGQAVGKGQVVGLAGSTGHSSGPHLHFDAILPKEKLQEYVELFGMPASGFFSGKTGLGIKVPSEPLVPIDEILRHQVVDEARASGLKFYAEIDRGSTPMPKTRVASIVGLVALTALGLVIARSEWA